MGNLDFQQRERIVLFAGAAAAAFLGLSALAEIAGHSLGLNGGRLASILILFYLCARIAGHAKTLEDRGRYEGFARFAWIAAPLAFVVLLVQTERTHSVTVQAASFEPTIGVTTWTRVEWTADTILFALFLISCMAVWIEDSTGASAPVARISFAIVGLLGADLLAIIWGMVDLLPQLRLLGALLVLSLLGWILVAILRRIERLDEQGPEPPAAPRLPVLPAPTSPPQVSSPHA